MGTQDLEEALKRSMSDEIESSTRTKRAFSVVNTSVEDAQLTAPQGRPLSSSQDAAHCSFQTVTMNTDSFASRRSCLRPGGDKNESSSPGASHASSDQSLAKATFLSTLRAMGFQSADMTRVYEDSDGDIEKAVAML